MSSAPARAVSMPVRPGASGPAAEPCKVSDILVSIGEVPYEWDIRSDALAWGANARHVLKVADAAAIATNGAFARLMCADNTQSRRDAVLLSGQGDAGAGVPYQVQYSIRAPGDVAPHHAETVHELLSRVHEALNAGKLRRRGSLEVYRPNAEREALRRENMRASDAIIGALNGRRIIPAFEPVVDAVSRRPAFHECLMRIGRGEGTLVGANDVMPIAERLGLVRLIDHRMLELVLAELAEARACS